MITYDELKTALTDISNICRMTNCYDCPFSYRVPKRRYERGCLLYDHTPNNWLDDIRTPDIEQFADRGVYLVENGYIED